MEPSELLIIVVVFLAGFTHAAAGEQASDRGCGFVVDTYNANVGDILFIHCVTNSKFLAFAHHGARFEEGNTAPNYLVFRQKRSAMLNIYTLLLTNVSAFDAGKFDCITETDKCFTEVKVYGKGSRGSISFNRRQLSVEAGNSIRLTCARPRSQIFQGFFKHNLEVVEDSRHQIESSANRSSLFITNVKDNDVGLYECQAGGERTVFKLSLKIAVKHLKSFYTLVNGQSGYLSSNVESDFQIESKPLITWFRFHREPRKTWNAATTREIAVCYGRFSKTVSSRRYGISKRGDLEIRNVAFEDAGFYKVQIDRGEAGIFSQIVKVTVI